MIAAGRVARASSIASSPSRARAARGSRRASRSPAKPAEEGVVVLGDEHRGVAGARRARPRGLDAGEAERDRLPASRARSVAREASTGRMTRKRLPRPGSDSTSIAAAVHLHEALDQRQAEAGAAHVARACRRRPGGTPRRSAAGRRCGCRCRGRSTSMHDAAARRAATRAGRRAARTRSVTAPPVGRELHRVREQVVEHLLDARRVGDDRRQVGRDLELDARSAARAATPCMTLSTPCTMSPSETGSKTQLHLAGLDLRQVEDVVDQAEQVAPAAEDVVQEARRSAARSGRRACRRGSRRSR